MFFCWISNWKQKFMEEVGTLDLESLLNSISLVDVHKDKWKQTKKNCFSCPHSISGRTDSNTHNISNGSYRILKHISCKTIILMNIYYTRLSESFQVLWNERFININLQGQLMKFPVSFPVSNIFVFLLKLQDVAKRQKPVSTQYWGLEGFFVVGASPKQVMLEARSSLCADSSPMSSSIPFPGNGVWIKSSNNIHMYHCCCKTAWI